MKTLKFFLNALGYASYAFMLLFTWVFALLSASLLIIVVVDKDWWGLVAVLGAALISCLCWSIRKDGIV